MADGTRIQVLVADGSAQTRDELSSVLAGHQDLVVVGSASSGDDAIAQTGRLKPDVVLMDIKIPGKSGVEATEVITAVLPNTAVIMLSDEGGADLLRKAMVAGARQFLLKPINAAEVVKTIHQVYQTTAARRVISGPPATDTGSTAAPRRTQPGGVVAVYSPKGGVGCTTVASNLAVAMSQDQHLRVALVDGSLAFGDLSVFFDLPPARSIFDLVQVPPEQLDADFVDGSLSLHRPSGVSCLLAPPSPEKAELISSEQLRRILGVLKGSHDYVVVDTSSTLDERILTILDAADRILLVFTLELTAIRDAKMFLDVVELLQFPPEKLLLVLTRAQSGQGISPRDLEQTLGRGLSAEISSDARLIVRSINQGEPVVLGERNSQVAQDFVALARTVTATFSGAAGRDADGSKAGRQGRFRLFSR